MKNLRSLACPLALMIAVSSAPAYADLGVGECVRDVVFNLSGEKGVYDIYRVR